VLDKKNNILTSVLHQFPKWLWDEIKESAEKGRKERFSSPSQFLFVPSDRRQPFGLIFFIPHYFTVDFPLSRF